MNDDNFFPKVLTFLTTLLSTALVYEWKGAMAAAVLFACLLFAISLAMLLLASFKDMLIRHLRNCDIQPKK